MCAKRKVYKKSDPAVVMRLLGGRKMASEAIKTANAIKSIQSNPAEFKTFINFGLPPITDMDGPAEC